MGAVHTQMSKQDDVRKMWCKSVFAVGWKERWTVLHLQSEANVEVP